MGQLPSEGGARTAFDPGGCRILRSSDADVDITLRRSTRPQRGPIMSYAYPRAPLG